MTEQIILKDLNIELKVEIAILLQRFPKGRLWKVSEFGKCLTKKEAEEFRIK